MYIIPTQWPRTATIQRYADALDLYAEATEAMGFEASARAIGRLWRQAEAEGIADELRAEMRRRERI